MRRSSRRKEGLFLDRLDIGVGVGVGVERLDRFVLGFLGVCIFFKLLEKVGICFGGDFLKLGRCFGAGLVSGIIVGRIFY